MAKKPKTDALSSTSSLTGMFDDFAAQFGKGLSLRGEAAGDTRVFASEPIGYVSTGSEAINALLGTKGIPLGKVTEFAGNPHVGKSTLAYQVVREAQRSGGVGVVFDIEGALTSDYLTKLGVSVESNKLIPIHPEDPSGLMSIEQAFNKMDEMIGKLKGMQTTLPAVIVLDSLGAMVDDDSKAKGITSDKMKPGAAAKAMANVMRHIAPKLIGTNIALIVINHVYDRIGIPGTEQYGGKGLKYAKAVALTLKNKGKLTVSDEEVGNTVEVAVSKIKLSDASGRRLEVGLIKNQGFDDYYSAHELLKGSYIQESGSGRFKIMDEELGEFKYTKQFLGLRKLCEENEALKTKVMIKYKEALYADLS